MNYFLVIGIGQGLLLAFSLFYKSWVKRNNAWLIGFFVLVITGFISGPMLNGYLGEPTGNLLVDPLILLIGPAFYLYILSFSKKLTVRDFALHGSAFFLYLPVLSVFYTQMVAAGLSPVSLQAAYRSVFAVSIGTLKFLHLFIYVFLSFSALRRHKIKVKRVFADLTGRDLAWLNYLLGAFIFLVIISLLLYVIALQHPEHQNRLTLLNLSLLSVFILTISFYAFHQHTLFDYAGDPANAKGLEAIVEGPEEPRYEKSGLKTEDAAMIQGKIVGFIRAKGYLNPDVTLGSMAAEIGVPPHKVSEVLSKYLQTSFYDLINRHRVEDIKRAIHDPARAHLTILAIAYDFGYNSKSTFNTAFKKFTGTTPSAFKAARI